jgi:small subunit ribosomal protein S2
MSMVDEKNTTESMVIETDLGDKTSSARLINDMPTDEVLQAMMKAGLHYGHRTSRTHPKMKPYISGVRNTVHIIDLKFTKEKLNEALAYIKELREQGKIILFIGTRVQVKNLVKEMAREVEMPYVSERWIGGFFTNFNTVFKRIERLNELEQQDKAGELDKYKKHEQLKIREEIRMLEKKFGGLKNLTKLPDAIFVFDLSENSLAVKEAKKKNIPVIAISDTNTDPDTVDYAIPANDDAVSSLTYIINEVKEVIQKTKPQHSTTPEKEIDEHNG